MAYSDSSEPENGRRVFGAGLKRKRVEFVPAAGASAPIKITSSAPLPLLGEKYLSITLKDNASSKAIAKAAEASNVQEHHEGQLGRGPMPSAVCEICKLPSNAYGDETTATLQIHETSLAHQTYLEHSYPPSHLDRNRQGLKYLSSYGWDPDSRLGLGASGTGIVVPVKAKMKHDTVGLGVKQPDDKKKVEKVPEKLDAKRVRKKDAEDKKRKEWLQQIFYANDDVEKYMAEG